MCEILFFCFFLSAYSANSAVNKKTLLTTSQTPKPRNKFDFKYLKNVKFCIGNDRNDRK